MEKKFLSGKMTSKGQLTVPIEIREMLELEDGDRLIFTVNKDGEVSITPNKIKTIGELVGILENTGEEA